jgi:ATP-dependent RNA helicase SUPV3L1/SUV3
MRRLKQKERLVADVNEKGEVSVEGHFVGRIDGFRFTVDATAETEELKTLRSASLAALQAEFSRRADKLYLSPDTELEVTDQGGLMWGSDAIGRLEKGDSPLAPRVRVFVDDIAEPAVAEKVERRLGHWITRRINTLFEPLLALRDDETVTGLARGVAFRLAEAMGVIPRRQITDDIRALGQDERGQLRKHGVRFGQHNIFMPLLLKPAPTRLRLILWSLWEGFEVFAEAPLPGLVTIPALADAPGGYYERVGYRLCGARALRIDMLERLADLIRPMDVRAGFEATPDMLSITGCTLEQLAELMKALGFDGERGERPKPARAAPETAKTAPVPEAAGSEAAGPAEDVVAEAAGAETPETEANAGDAGDVSAPEIEIFYTFRLRPRQHPGPGGQRRRAESDGEAGGERRGRNGGKTGGVPGERGKGRPGGKGKPARRERPGHSGADQAAAAKPARRDEKPIDPLSPFAVLQQLKDK